MPACIHSLTPCSAQPLQAVQYAQEGAQAIAQQQQEQQQRPETDAPDSAPQPMVTTAHVLVVLLQVGHGLDWISRQSCGKPVRPQCWGHACELWLMAACGVLHVLKGNLVQDRLLVRAACSGACCCDCVRLNTPAYTHKHSTSCAMHSAMLPGTHAPTLAYLHIVAHAPPCSHAGGGPAPSTTRPHPWKPDPWVISVRATGWCWRLRCFSLQPVAPSQCSG